jgi:hypothetical protein
MSEPLYALLRSRKFLLAVLDAIVSTVLFLAGQYFPQYLGDIKFVILTMQPVILMVIGAYAYEDAQIKSALAVLERSAELQAAAQLRRDAALR